MFWGVIYMIIGVLYAKDYIKWCNEHYPDDVDNHPIGYNISVICMLLSWPLIFLADALGLLVGLGKKGK